MEIKTLGSTLTINQDFIDKHPDKCAKIKAELIRINKEYQTPKSRPVDRVANHPIIIMPFTTEHPRRSRYSYNRDYTKKPKLVFNDCLPGKAWVKAHYQDEMPEPTIEVIVSGKRVATINGDYKKGMIKQLLKS